MNNDYEIRKGAIINSATEQMRGLLETHFRELTKAAVESFQGDENQSEPIAKFSVTIQFGAIAAATAVNVRCSWSVKYADESEEEIDPLQSKLGLPEVSPKVRAIAEEIQNASPSVRRAATHLVQALKDNNMTMTAKEGA